MENKNFKESKYQEFKSSDKSLYRTNYNKVFLGVINGLAEYLEVKVTILRVVLSFTSIFLPFLLLLYFISAFMLPIKEKHQT